MPAGYEPVEPGRVYRVLVTDYLAAGGDGFGPVLARCDVEPLPPPIPSPPPPSKVDFPPWNSSDM